MILKCKVYFTFFLRQKKIDMPYIADSFIKTYPPIPLGLLVLFSHSALWWCVCFMIVWYVVRIVYMIYVYIVCMICIMCICIYQHGTYIICAPYPSRLISVISHIPCLHCIITRYVIPITKLRIF